MITQFGDWFNLCDVMKTPIERELYDAEFPSFVDFSRLNTNYKRLTTDEIYDYYVSVLNGKFDFVLQNEDTLSCDYCEVITELQWIRNCTVCNKNMCNLCWNERSEETALANGSIRWSERKASLELCFAHEKEGKLQVREIKPLRVTCNLCNCSSAYSPGVWRSNRSVNQDLCGGCSKTTDGIYFMANISGMWKLETYEVFQHLLFDWLPICKDETENLIVFNIRKNSPYYHRIIDAEKVVENRVPPKYVYNLDNAFCFLV